MDWDIQNKTVIITGGTSGIGLAAATSLATLGPNLVLPVRDLKKGEIIREELIDYSGNKNIEIFPCDLSSLKSVAAFVRIFSDKYPDLHVLINNAGIWENNYSETEDGHETTWQVNFLASLFLTELLKEKIVASKQARIIFTTSESHKSGHIDFENLENKKNFSGYKAYANSKLAQLLITKQLSEIFGNKGITVNAFHPGVVRTHIFDLLSSIQRIMMNTVMISPERGAQTLVYLSTSPEVLGVTGEYFYKSAIADSSMESRDQKLAEKLYNTSMESLITYLGEQKCYSD
jgi:NAD(P)-dependent dehydrogenase (short-subunit alcohol dehydrogenase family)